jgi:hypothetical protein
MRSTNRFGHHQSLWQATVFACCAVILVAIPCTAAEKVLKFDFDDSDPVEFSARIMEINHEKAQLVVAEELIYVVDFMIAEHRFFTEINDSKGNPSVLELFKQGDMVLVRGFKTSDGVVFASLLQKAKKPKFKHKNKPGK